MQLHPTTPTMTTTTRSAAATAGAALVHRLDRMITGFLTRYSLPLLRISLGLIFLGFGVLKFFPDVSPAEELAQATMSRLTLSIVPDSVGILLVAAMETAIGLSLITGRQQRIGIALLAIAMVGVLSPIAFFPGQLFAGPSNAPTLEGQYVIKDLILLTSSMVVAVGARGGRITTEPDAEQR